MFSRWGAATGAAGAKAPHADKNEKILYYGTPMWFFSKSPRDERYYEVAAKAFYFFDANKNKDYFITFEQLWLFLRSVEIQIDRITSFDLTETYSTDDVTHCLGYPEFFMVFSEAQKIPPNFYETNDKPGNRTDSDENIPPENESGKSSYKKVIFGLGVGTVIGAGIGVLAVPLVLGGLGFTAGGVAASSIAAGWQSSIGSVVAGSWFAAFQSAGAAGAGAAGMAAGAGTGATFGGGFGAAFGAAGDFFSNLFRNKQTKAEHKNMYENFGNKEAFERFSCFDEDKDGFITYEQLWLILQSWKLEIDRRTAFYLMETYSTDEVKHLLTFPEFLTLMLDERIMRASLKKAFASFDDDQDEFIDVKQLWGLLNYLQVEIDIQTAYKLIIKYGEMNKTDIKITFPQFLELLADQKVNKE